MSLDFNTSGLRKTYARSIYLDQWMIDLAKQKKFRSYSGLMPIKRKISGMRMINLKTSWVSGEEQVRVHLVLTDDEATGSVPYSTFDKSKARLGWYKAPLLNIAAVNMASSEVILAGS